nr:immunoglobulin light chain junction region [Macaca mulatta]
DYYCQVYDNNDVLF